MGRASVAPCYASRKFLGSSARRRDKSDTRPALDITSRDGTRPQPVLTWNAIEDPTPFQRYCRHWKSRELYSSRTFCVVMLWYNSCWESETGEWKFTHSHFVCLHLTACHECLVWMGLFVFHFIIIIIILCFSLFFSSSLCNGHCGDTSRGVEYIYRPISKSMRLY